MSRTPTYALAVLAIFAAPLCAQSQKPAPPPPCPPSSGADQSKASKPCTPASDKKEPSASQRFPFPGEQTSPSQQAKPDTPEAPASSGKPPAAADKFPFPTASAPPMPGSDSDTSSSSSSSSSADTPSPDNPAGDTGDTPHPSSRRRLPKVENLQTNEERVDEDLKVAKFYSDAGDLNAAYLRVRDAVKYLPDDPDTHFALAYVAQKMKKREEAIAEYNNYLRLAPDGERTEDARKALNDLKR